MEGNLWCAREGILPQMLRFPRNRGWGSTELHRHSVRISRLFPGFSQHHAGRESRERLTHTTRLVSEDSVWSAELHSAHSPTITLIFLCAVTAGKSQPFHERPQRQPEATSIPQHVPSLSNTWTWTLSQLMTPCGFQ